MGANYRWNIRALVYAAENRAQVKWWAVVIAFRCSRTCWAARAPSLSGGDTFLVLSSCRCLLRASLFSPGVSLPPLKPPHPTQVRLSHSRSRCAAAGTCDENRTTLFPISHMELQFVLVLMEAAATQIWHYGPIPVLPLGLLLPTSKLRGVGGDTAHRDKDKPRPH